MSLFGDTGFYQQTMMSSRPWHSSIGVTPVRTAMVGRLGIGAGRHQEDRSGTGGHTGSGVVRGLFGVLAGPAVPRHKRDAGGVV